MHSVRCFLQRYEEELGAVASDRNAESDSNRGLRGELHADRQSPEAMQWTCLAPGMVKINSDASFLAESGQTWAGQA